MTSTFLHVKSQERYSGDTVEMSSSPGLVTVILFLLGKQNPSKNLDSIFCYVNKTFKRNFIPEFYAQDHRELYYFPLGQTRGDSVSQMDGQVTLLEGATLTVNCTYSATGYPTLFWYVQYPGEGPELLLKAMKANDKETNKGFVATYNTETTSFHLEKASVQESDSAVYYCALSDTVTETAGGAEHKLRAAMGPGSTVAPTEPMVVCLLVSG